MSTIKKFFFFKKKAIKFISFFSFLLNVIVKKIKIKERRRDAQ